MTERKHVIRERRTDERTTRLECWCGWSRNIETAGTTRERPTKRIEAAVRDHDAKRCVNVSAFQWSPVRRATHA